MPLMVASVSRRRTPVATSRSHRPRRISPRSSLATTVSRDENSGTDGEPVASRGPHPERFRQRCDLAADWIYEQGNLAMPSCVLAYSGGLDTSVILGWLLEQGYQVHCLYVDLGQPCENREAMLDKALQDRRHDGSDRGRAGGTVPRLRVSRARLAGQIRIDLPAGHLDRSAADHQEVPGGGPRGGATAFAHGATGKGNDQCRFQLAADALAPDIQVIAPWRIEAFRQRFPGRTEMIAYCEERTSRSKPRSRSPTVRTKTACTSATRRASWKI